jgi:hypothetical protein
MDQDMALKIEDGSNVSVADLLNGQCLGLGRGDIASVLGCYWMGQSQGISQLVLVS